MSASHAEGRGFEPRPEYFFSFFVLGYGMASSTIYDVASVKGKSFAHLPSRVLNLLSLQQHGIALAFP